MPHKSSKAGTATRSKNTVRRQRAVQREVDRADARRSSSRPSEKKQQKGSSKQEAPVQAGARAQPVPPLTRQHLQKPGLESDLELAPRYLAPDYEGSSKLQGKVALITGGDSGIGRAVAVLYAREGADVAIVYLPVEQSDAEATQQAVEDEGQRCLLVPGDVTDFAFCEKAVARVVQKFGQLDILVNNAAFQEHASSLDELSLDHFDLTMRTNLYGYFHMVKAALPHLAPGSAIVNTGSVTGLVGNKRLVDYATTKGGIHALTKSLSEMLLPKGIRVNAVAPGPVCTPLNPADADQEHIAEFGAKVPMHRPAQPEEISPAYVFLAAPVCSSYISGEVLPILGGYRGG
jgi:NAD(P)-dependent dehydrogenase (short-subunit alcohol dehydrogenase family)